MKSLFFALLSLIADVWSWLKWAAKTCTWLFSGCRNTYRQFQYTSLLQCIAWLHQSTTCFDSMKLALLCTSKNRTREIWRPFSRSDCAIWHRFHSTTVMWWKTIRVPKVLHVLKLNQAHRVWLTTSQSSFASEALCSFRDQGIHLEAGCIFFVDRWLLWRFTHIWRKHQHFQGSIVITYVVSCSKQAIYSFLLWFSILTLLIVLRTIIFTARGIIFKI